MKTDFIYPSKNDLETFIFFIKENNFRITKYLPRINQAWFEIVSDSIQYVETTAHYEPGDLFDCCARLLYKIAKRHELGDGNKRSSVIVVYLFCILNNKFVTSPAKIKREAKRAARTKGRENEKLIRKRISEEIKKTTTELIE